MYSLFSSLVRKIGTLTQVKMCTFCVLICICVNTMFCMWRWWTFWLLSGTTSKVIILWLLPYYFSTKVPLYSTVTRFHHLGLNEGWAFDWQPINDIISSPFGKWSSGNSRLVRRRGGPNRGQFVKADVSSVMDGGARLAARNCLTFLFEETLGGGEWGWRSVAGKSAWPAFHCTH